MITEVITYVRQQCVVGGVSTAFQDLIPSDETTNVCAVRSLPGSVNTNFGSCTKFYTTQLFSILYRGDKDRLTSLNVIDSVSNTLNDASDIDLTNTYITYIQGEKPTFAFEDENGNIHYNLNIEVRYNKK